MKAEVFEAKSELSFHLFVNIPRYANAAGVGQRLEARRYVYAVAKEVFAIDHHVAEVDPDAELHFVPFRKVERCPGKVALDLEPSPHGFDRAGKFGNEAVARPAEDPAAVLLDETCDGDTASAQCAIGTLLV
nr:hypothetical protein [Mesorhizobium sp.]